MSDAYKKEARAVCADLKVVPDKGLTTQEAEEIFMKKQFDVLQGNMYEGNAEERRKLYLWIAFNPALFKLLESLHGLTRDVNYTMN